jgi:hypothetical protein
MKNIYLLRNNGHINGMMKGCIVVADSESEAARINPSEHPYQWTDRISVEKIGVADENLDRTILEKW